MTETHARRPRFSPGLLAAVLTIVVTTSSSFTLAADRYRIRVSTDRKNAVYSVGESATFSVLVTKNDKPWVGGRVNVTVNDFVRRTKSPFSRKTLVLKDEPVAVKASLKKPGFLRCTAVIVTPDKKRLQASIGAGFSPKKISPSLPVPDDFDAFWAGQKKKLAAVPMKPTLTPVSHNNDKLKCFDVQVACLGGAPVSGYFARPKSAKPKSLPAILWVHGAGVRSSSLGNATAGASMGMISMDINAHGIPNGKPGTFYRKLNAGRLRGYRHAGRKSRETIYFRGMFLRLIRAIDFLTAQPEWDGQTLIVIGHSQGGGQALAAGGLDSRVTMIASGVPAICDHSGVVVDRVNGWPKLVPNGPNGKPIPEILKAARYVDAVNLASRCRADAIMSVGFIDGVCPPSSCYAAFNALKGKKRMVNRPSMSHAAPKEIRDAFLKAIRDHIRSRKTKS